MSLERPGPIGTIQLSSRVGALALRPLARELYVTLPEKQAVAIVDTYRMQTVFELPVGDAAEQIGFAPDGSRAYVTAGRAPGRLIIIDPPTRDVLGSVAMGDQPEALAVSPLLSDAHPVDPVGPPLTVPAKLPRTGSPLPPWAEPPYPLLAALALAGVMGWALRQAPPRGNGGGEAHGSPSG